MHAPQVCRQEFEVTLHENHGPNNIFVIWVGTFPTLELAQRAAQEALALAVSNCIAKGYSGAYFDKINLEYCGLVTGLNIYGQLVAEKQIRIDLRETFMRPEYRTSGADDPGYHNTIDPPSDANYYRTHDSCCTIPAVEGVLDLTEQQATEPLTTGTMETFAQTCLPFPNRPLFWVPRDHYDETMMQSLQYTQRDTASAQVSQGLPAPKARNKKGNNRSAHRRSLRRKYRETRYEEDAGGHLDEMAEGGSGSGAAYLGRRHSFPDLRAKELMGGNEYEH